MSTVQLTYKNSSGSQKASHEDLMNSNSNFSLKSNKSLFVSKGSRTALLQRSSSIKRPSSDLSLSRSTTNDDFIDEQVEFKLSSWTKYWCGNFKYAIY